MKYCWLKPRYKKGREQDYNGRIEEEESFKLEFLSSVLHEAGTENRQRGIKVFSSYLVNMIVSVIISMKLEEETWHENISILFIV